jgi:hypothetical protein
VKAISVPSSPSIVFLLVHTQTILPTALSTIPSAELTADAATSHIAAA